jgi:hypothetical protein
MINRGSAAYSPCSPGPEPLGCTEAILLAHGLKLQLLVDLVRDGLVLCQLRVRHVSPHLLERPSSVADYAITRTRRIS